MPSIVERILGQPCVAIDLGTANTRVHACGQENIAEEPSLVRHVSERDADSPDAYIAHLNAKFVSSPLRGGVVVDVNNAISLLRPLLRRTRSLLRQPVSLACAPTDTSEKERKWLADAILGAGATHVAIIPEPWAAAIGAGLDVTAASARMLVDIGDGVTDLAVIRDGRLVYTTAVRTACHDLRQAIRNAVLSRYRISLYPADLEQLTHVAGSGLDSSAAAAAASREIPLRGMDIVRRCEVELTVRQDEILAAMEPVLEKMLGMIERSIRKMPEWYAAEVCDTGICLTGGGSCIKGIDRLIAARTNLTVRIAPDPVHAVINGAIQTVRYWKERQDWWEQIAWPTLSS
ncbi:MAG: rod shape-determining protein [Thermodesulfobacteriota bacterium]